MTVLLMTLSPAFPLLAADQMLFDFTQGLAKPPQVECTEATAALVHPAAGTSLRVRTGHNQPWPGITLKAPSGHWDLSPFSSVVVALANPGSNSVTVNCRVDNPGADGKEHCVSGAVTLAPHSSGAIRALLKRTSGDTLGGKLFGMRGYPVKMGGPGTIDPANITQLLLFVAKPTRDHSFDVLQVYASGLYTSPTAWVTDAVPYFPLIDAFGQYRHKDWPGKVVSQEDLQARRQEEAHDLAAHPGPAGWDKYGGFANGPQLEATGFFRTRKVHGKWWLVDPDGRLFFSNGIDCVGQLDFTPIQERENWFADSPWAQPSFGQFLSRQYALKGHYAGRTVECFSFQGANLLRKYGAEWQTIRARLIHQRLRSWGLNTIGNWSDPSIYGLHLTAYTDAVGSGRTRMIQGSQGYWGKFPDVFDASFADSIKASAASKIGKSAGDPWCIGYFSDNEMSWGDDTSLAMAALRSPADQPAKLAFVSDLQGRYGKIGRLNEAWGTQYASWEALRESREAPELEKAESDLKAFYTRLAERYFRVVRESIKEVAPHQLYLGCRFAWVNARAAAAAAKYCDVVSYNLYHRSVVDFRFNGGADVPLIIGEFHLGALDRGLFHPGLVPVANQEERSQAYSEYVLGAVRHPQFVGCHWFQYLDEPTTGRVHDEENYQIGFVDVADTPYREMIGACRRVANELYETAR